MRRHLVKTFNVSNDPQFAEELIELVGLSLNPPKHALVLSCDEPDSSPRPHSEEPADVPGSAEHAAP